MKTSMTTVPATIKTATAIEAAMMTTGVVTVVVRWFRSAGVLKRRSAQSRGIDISSRRESATGREILAVKAVQINESHDECERKDKNNCCEKDDPNHSPISLEEQYAAATPLSPINFNSI
jgi:hypothetical protein